MNTKQKRITLVGLLVFVGTFLHLPWYQVLSAEGMVANEYRPIWSPYGHLDVPIVLAVWGAIAVVYIGLYWVCADTKH